MSHSDKFDGIASGLLFSFHNFKAVQALFLLNEKPTAKVELHAKPESFMRLVFETGSPACLAGEAWGAAAAVFWERAAIWVAATKEVMVRVSCTTRRPSASGSLAAEELRTAAEDMCSFG